MDPFGGDLLTSLGGVGLGALFVLVLIFILRAIGVGRSDRLERTVSTFDLEKMRRQGLMTEEEYKRVQERHRATLKGELERAFEMPKTSKRPASAEAALADLEVRLEVEGPEAILADAPERPQAKPIKLRDEPLQQEDIDRLRLLVQAQGGEPGLAESYLRKLDAQQKGASGVDNAQTVGDDWIAALDPLGEGSTPAAQSAVPHLDRMLADGVITREEHERMSAHYGKKAGR